MRQNFSAGMEILHSDLNLIQARANKTILEQYIFNLMGNKGDGFFNKSFKVEKTGDFTISLKKGVGLQLVAGSDYETKIAPIHNPEDSEVIINTPETGFMVGVYVKYNLAAIETETRRYKPEFEDTIYTQEFDTVLDNAFEYELSYGEDDGLFEDPDVVEDHLLIALVKVTDTGIEEISDKRKILPFITANGSNGQKYDAIVGNDEYCTHPDINSALSDEKSVKNILISTDIEIDEDQIISEKVLIESKSGCRIISDGIAKIQISASGVSIIGCHFDSFDTAITIDSLVANTLISQCRFSDCTNDIEDNGSNTVSNANIFEV